MSLSNDNLRSSRLSDDELRLQLLVDGQLDHSERSQWLASISADSEQWRKIALRFVENQIMDEAIGTIAVEPHRLILQPKPTPVASSRRIGWSWIAIAASLLVGWLLGSQAFGPSDSEVAIVKSPKATTANRSEELNEESSKPVPSTDGSEHAVFRLPLEDALARSIRPVSLDTHRAFLKAGYILDESSKIADVELPTGSSVKMPVRNVTIRYLGKAAYQ